MFVSNRHFEPLNTSKVSESIPVVLLINFAENADVPYSDTPTYNRLIAKNLRNNGETCR